MRLTRQSNRQTIAIPSASVLGRGGEAQIVAWPQDSQLVAKLYFEPTDAHANKLQAMVKNPPGEPHKGTTQPSIAWPVDLLHFADNGRFAGFLMPRVTGCQPVINYYNPLKRRSHCPLFNYRYLHRTAQNLAAAVAAVHQRGYVSGDVNESNILVAPTSLVTLVDTDSFQVCAAQPGRSVTHRCPVGKPEYTPPELQGKNFGTVDRRVEHDLFGLAALIFQLLMEGFHPFAGGYSGSGEPPLMGERIARGYFPYGKRRLQRCPPAAPPYEILHPKLQAMFIRCFEDGHSMPSARPSAAEWKSALAESEKRL